MNESDVIRRVLSTRPNVIIHYGENKVELESSDHQCRKHVLVPKDLLPKVREFIMAPRPIEAGCMEDNKKIRQERRLGDFSH